jgi:hypothetical protein
MCLIHKTASGSSDVLLTLACVSYIRQHQVAVMYCVHILYWLCCKAIFCILLYQSTNDHLSVAVNTGFFHVEILHPEKTIKLLCSDIQGITIVNHLMDKCGTIMMHSLFSLDAKLGISGYVYDWSCRYISCDHMVKNIIYQPVLAWVVYLIMAY